MAQLKSQDVANAEATRAELERLCSEIGWMVGDAHNVMQRITWDASADAKAAKVSVGYHKICIQFYFASFSSHHRSQTQPSNPTIHRSRRRLFQSLFFS